MWVRVHLSLKPFYNGTVQRFYLSALNLPSHFFKRREIKVISGDVIDFSQMPFNPTEKMVFVKLRFGC